MRAAVLREPGRLELEELDLPDPAAGEVRVRLVASGVCGSDGSAYRGHIPVPLPAVLGHEGAGVVDAIGPGITDLEPGEHVVLTITPGCGTCFQCQHAAFGLCEVGSPHFLDGTLLHGQRRLSKGVEPVHHFLSQSSFAEYAVVERWNAVRIEPDVPLDVACLAACGVTTGFGAAVNRARIRPGETVLVIGAGGVGLAAVIGAQVAGADRIIVADTNPAATALAAELGATDQLPAGEAMDLPAAVRALVARGVDAAIDAVGTQGTVRAAFDALRHGGRAVLVGAAAAREDISIPMYGLIQQKVLTGSTNGSIRPHVDIPNILALHTAGRIALDRLITARYPLEQVGTALDELGRRPGRAVLSF